MKTPLIKLLLASCLLFFSLTTQAAATLNIATITTNNTGIDGLAASPLNSNQTGIAIMGFSARSSSTGTNYSVTGFTFTGSSAISAYFSNAKLYSSTNTTYTAGSDPVVTGASATISGSTVSFTFPTQTITNTTKYYFLIVDYTAPVAAATFQFSITGVTGATGSGLPQSGPSYTLTPPVTLGSVSATGLAVSPLSTSQTGIAILGFSVTTKQSLTFSSFQFTATQPIGTYFSNIKLYSSTNNSYTSGTDPVVTGTTITVSGTSLTVSGLSQAINTATKYYYIVADYTAPITATTFQLSLNSASTSTATYTNGGDIDGTNYALTPPVTLGTVSATGLAVSPLSTSQTGIAILGFSVTTKQSFTFSSFQFTATQPIGTYFSNIKLYSSTNNSYTSGTDPVVTGTTITVSGTSLTVSGLSQAINNTTKYYYIVADYTVASSASSTFQLSLNSASTSTATYTNGADINGTNYTLSSDLCIWTGSGSNANWTNTSNWQDGHIPTTYDFVQIAYTYNPDNSNNVPSITANTTIAGLFFGGQFTSQSGKYWPGISVGTGATLTINGDFSFNVDNYPGLVTTPIVPGPDCNLYFIQGAGSIITNSLSIYANYGVTSASSSPYATQQAIVSTVGSLKILGDLSLTSALYKASRNSSYDELATFYVLQNTTEIDGNVNTYNTYINGATASTTDPTSTFGVVPYPTNTTNATLILKGANVLSNLSSAGANSILFGATNANVNYAGASQTIYTDNNSAINLASGQVNYYNLTLSGTGAKTSNGGNLTVSGNFTNSLTNDASNYAVLTSSNVTFDGTTAQTLAGGLGTGTTFKACTFSGASTKTMASGYFNISSTGLLTMSGTSTSTVLNAAGGALLTLQSDANNSASIAAISGPSITGSVNVQRYLTGGNINYRGYRLLSSPVNISNSIGGTGNTGLKYVNTDVTIPATAYGALNGGPAGGGFAVPNGNPTMYLYNEALATNNSTFTGGKDVGITALTSTGVSTLSQGITKTGVTVPVGNGYMLYFVGNDHSLVTAGTRVPEGTTITATGYINQGNITFKMWGVTNSSVLSYASPAAPVGYNLVGNPYASTIDLAKLFSDNGGTATNSIYRIFAVLNDVNPNQGFGYYNASSGAKSGTTAIASQYVASGQGFFVQAGAANQSLVFKEDQKIYDVTKLTGTSTPPGVLRLQPKNGLVTNNSLSSENTDALIKPANNLTGLHLRLQKDSLTFDECGIYFDNKWSDDYDVDDAYIFAGSSKISVYSYTKNGAPVGINSLADYHKGKRIKMYIKAAANGVYNLKMTDILNIDTTLFNVYLIDNYKKDSLDMVRYKSYAFDLATTDTSSFGANRFVLAVERKPLPPYALVAFTGEKVKGGVQLNWKTYNEGDYTGFVLQKQTNGKFTQIDSLQSNNAADYTYTDKNPLTGINVYRLKQNDINGIVTYSAPVTITYNNASAPGVFSVYPNPSRELITVNVSTVTTKTSNLVSNIYNTSGELVGHRTVNGNTWTEDVTSYKAGIYVIELQSNDGSLVGKTKFVKTN